MRDRHFQQDEYGAQRPVLSDLASPGLQDPQSQTPRVGGECADQRGPADAVGAVQDDQ
ncbi:hypothetical protein P3L51_04900 [Streptomyces sp. PSRA5]|uniref:hypothetical protein n=1 Tax=Streptomyces panacea TaxID=3035064 RepID=UPI00339C93D4